MDNEKMFPTKVTRLSRYEFQDGGFLHSDSDGVEVFGTLNVLVPEDDPAPTVRDLTDEERDADAMLRDEARERGKKVLAPATKFVLFKRGMVLEPNGIGIYKEGLGVYVPTNADGPVPVRDFPDAVTNVLFNEELPSEDGQLDPLRTLALLRWVRERLTSKQGGEDEGTTTVEGLELPDKTIEKIKEKYGNGIKIRNGIEAGEKGPYALVNVIEFTGAETGLVDAVAGDNRHGRLKLMERTAVICEPGTVPKVEDIPADVVEIVSKATKGRFVPTQVARIPNSAMVEDTAGITGMVTGDHAICVQPGVVMRTFKAWLPKQPLVEDLNYKNFLGESDTYEDGPVGEALAEVQF